MKTKPVAHSIEPLETRIAPAAVFTFTDVDGDLVTIKTSKGTNADLAAILTRVPGGLGDELQRIDFSMNAAVFAGANLSVTAKRTAVGGDGLVNVGFIDAGTDDGGAALDLGLVTIRGDLGRIVASGATTTIAAVKGLSVQSIGQFGTSTQGVGGNLLSVLNGALGFLKVAGNVKEAIFVVGGGANGTIGPVNIAGSLIGGTDGDSGEITSSGAMGPVKIGGNIQGGTGNGSGHIESHGTLASITIGGSLLGGTGDNSGEIFSSGAMGWVKIGGNIEGGGIASGRIAPSGTLAGVTIGGSLVGRTGGGSGSIVSGAFGSGGAMGPVKIGGNIEGDGIFTGNISASSLARITLGGSLLGGPNSLSGNIVSRGAIGPVKIGGNIEGSDSNVPGSVEYTGFIQGDRIASLFVGGSIIAGTESGGGTLVNSGAVSARDNIGSITIKGSLIGNSTNPVLITARGQATPGATTDIAIKSLTVGGRVEFTDILGGYGYDLGGTLLTGLNADAQIGAVIVGGDWIASNLVAGVQDNADADRNDFFGEGDDQRIGGGSAGIVSKIASILIKGTVLGTVGGVDHFGFLAQQIGSFKIGVTAFPLTPGPANDLAGLPVGVTGVTLGDLRVREVAL